MVYLSNCLGPLVQLDTTNNIYYIDTWVLLPQLTMEFLPHDFYMINYIKDISKWRNNISKGEYNKSTIEYLLKLQYFNTPSWLGRYSTSTTTIITTVQLTGESLYVIASFGATSCIFIIKLSMRILDLLLQPQYVNDESSSMSTGSSSTTSLCKYWIVYEYWIVFRNISIILCEYYIIFRILYRLLQYQYIDTQSSSEISIWGYLIIFSHVSMWILIHLLNTGPYSLT